MNLIIPKKVTDDERSRPHESSKGVRDHLPWGCSCGPIRSPLMIFLGIVEFILLRSFQRYRRCHHWSFNVSLESLFFFFSHLFFCWILCLRDSRMILTTCKSQILSADFLNCTIYLNIFCVMLFYWFFLVDLKNSMFLCTYYNFFKGGQWLLSCCTWKWDKKEPQKCF